ncbi:MAG: hypothetical protein ABIU09_04520, partial [Pyrinomonadaceae bacterium]
MGAVYLAESHALLERTTNPIAMRGVYHDSKPVTAERERSIAVLPFRLIGVHDTSGRRDEEYLSLGLADAVTMSFRIFGGSLFGPQVRCFRLRAARSPN